MPWCQPIVSTLLLVVVLTTRDVRPTAAQSLPPRIDDALSNPVKLGGANVEQMVFDATRQRLYVANYGRNTIVRIAQIDSVPLVPSHAAPWVYEVIAGRDGGAGTLPVPSEAVPSDAALGGPTGIIGWPWYAALGPHCCCDAALPQHLPYEQEWVGLWVMEHQHHTVRFIDFGRGNNATLVAGSPWGVAGGHRWPRGSRTSVQSNQRRLGNLCATG